MNGKFVFMKKIIIVTFVVLCIATSAWGDASFEETKISAEQGDAKAQFNLGMIYYTVKGPHKDTKKAFYWFTKAAEQGNADGQFLLGALYNYGNGTPVDYKKALYWYTKAAKQGNYRAHENIYMIYSHKDGGAFHKGGIPKNNKKAFYWLTKAAEQGDGDCQFILGLMYKNGDGILQDYKQAYAWFNLAATASTAIYENAKSWRDRTSKLLSSKQVVEAQQLSIEIQKRINVK